VPCCYDNCNKTTVCLRIFKMQRVGIVCPVSLQLFVERFHNSCVRCFNSTIRGGAKAMC
jgi:hypothetical protein